MSTHTTAAASNKNIPPRSNVLVVLCCLALSQFAQARESAIDIPAGTLAEALEQLAKQTGADLVYRPEQVAGIRTQGIKGKLTTAEAIDKLLQGTQLRVSTSAAGAYLIATPKTTALGRDTELIPNPVLRLAQTDQNEAAAVADETRESASASPEDSAAGSLYGHVRDSRSGSNLPGALVRVLETGSATETDSLGYFRLRGIAPGRYTVSVSYLGLAERTWAVRILPGRELSSEFALTDDAGDLEEVTVSGNRSARALALNQQRTAENSSSIISADMLGNFTGTTISEALRRVEGIALVRNSVTGDGTNVVIRGMEPNLNNIQLNGLNLPGNFHSVVDLASTDRSPDLSFLLADSVGKITVNKSLLPSHDSAGSGGLVQIETKSPLDRPRRFANFSFEGGRKGRDFGDDFIAAGTLSGTFGSRSNFGVSAAAQYRERSTRNFQYNTQLIYGPFLPLAEDGTPLQDSDLLDPRRTFPYEPEGNRVFPHQVDQTLLERDNTTLSITLSSAWQPSDHTDFRLDLVRAVDRSDTFSRSASFSAGGEQQLVPVAALGGEERYVQLWTGEGGRGTSVIHQYTSQQDVQSISDTFSFNGKTTVGRIDFNYTLGYARGSTDNPQETTYRLTYEQPDDAAFDPAFVSEEAIDPIEGRIITMFGERTGRGYPIPHLSEAGFAFFDDADNYVTGQRLGQRKIANGFNRKQTADVSAHYAVDRGHLRYLEIGANYETQKFKRNPRTNFELIPVGAFRLTASELGLSFDEPGLAAIGRSERGFKLISRELFESFADHLPELAAGDDPLLEFRPVELHPLYWDQYTQEDNFATYLQARLDFGKLEIIGGPRLSRVRTLASRLSFPEVLDEFFMPHPDFPREQFTRFLNESAVATDVLPRLLVNYRQRDNLIFRGGYFLSVARPSLAELSSEQTVSLSLSEFSAFDPLGQNPGALLSIHQGNPGLKPTVTHSFDLSVEYYHDDIGLMRLSGFYKRSKNLIETNIGTRVRDDLSGFVLPDHPLFAPENLPENLYIQAQRPVNSRYPAHLWGVEVGVERQFTFLPGIWSGLGIYTNLTYTDSSKTAEYEWLRPYLYDDDGFPISGGDVVTLFFEDQAYQQASAWSGTASLTYNKYGIDATLAYSLQARALADFDFQPHGLEPYNEQYESLDLRIAREFTSGLGKYTVFFEGADLLKGPSDSDLETTIGGRRGASKAYVGGGFIGGRQLKLGLRAAF